MWRRRASHTRDSPGEEHQGRLAAGRTVLIQLMGERRVALIEVEFGRRPTLKLCVALGPSSIVQLTSVGAPASDCRPPVAGRCSGLGDSTQVSA